MESRTIRYDLMDMNRILTGFRIRMDKLKDLNVGDKITFSNKESLIIHSSSLTQSLIRWFSGDSRGIALETLRYLMDDLIMFLKMMLMCSWDEETAKNKDFHLLWFQSCCFIKNIIHGLEMLLITYKDDSVYCDKLEPYKSTFQIMLEQFNLFEEKIKTSLI